MNTPHPVPRPARSKAGYSLVEVTLALLVVAIGLTATFSLFPEAMKNTRAAVDDAEVARRLDYETARLDEVVNYAKSRRCRQVELIGYFGEDAGDWRCGCCDICADAGGSSTANFSEADIRVALRAADIFHGRIGLGKLGQILSGSRSASVIAGNWHRNPCFGALRRLRSARVEELLRALMDSGDLGRVDRDGYPCVILSEQGRARLMR